MEQKTDRWGDPLNQYALDMGIIEFGNRWRIYHDIPKGTRIFGLKDFFDDFKHNVNQTFLQYMQEIGS